MGLINLIKVLALTPIYESFNTFVTKYSRMGQAKFVEDNL